MQLRQTARHIAAKRALQLPGLRSAARRGLVALHTKAFLERADPANRDARRDHLEALFDATTDIYLAALEAGHDEATAREITHIVANFDFYNHGWTEMMEFPGAELGTHYERYETFFDRHGIAIDDPLGMFAPADGLPDAPATPERLSDPDYPDAVPGYADDTYVEGDPDETTVSPTDAPGVED
ncbi:MAG: DUF6149 family protein [Halobacteriaceae archaeon]